MVNLPVIDSISQFPQLLTFPHFEYIKLKVVWIAALQIGIIASIESLLSVEAVDKIDELKRTTNPNRELIAQGTGNIVAGFLGGLPITSVIVRSSANVNSGAKTKLSAILHGLLLAVAILIFPKVMNLIPLSALAAVLIYTGFKLAKPSVFKDAFKKGAAVFVPFLATIFAILLSDLLIGICIGILVGVFFIVRSNFKAALRFADRDGAHMIRFGLK
ncbi:MAG: SulP family inorganic anion transporter [Bacteroidia bacterium]|nr:SulP family inorganic anion transporter [Bacteroidia bacterium]